jgi:hypothetical protein
MKREGRERVNEKKREITIGPVAEPREVALLQPSEIDHDGIVAELRIIIDTMSELGIVMNEGMSAGMTNTPGGIDEIREMTTAGGVMTGRTRNRAAVRLVATEAVTDTAVGDMIALTNLLLDVVLAHANYIGPV